MQSTGLSCVNAPLGLVGWWTAENAAIDARGTNSGRFSGEFGLGMVGHAFSVAPGRYVSIRNAPILNPSSISVEVWLRRDFAVGGADPVVKKAGEGAAQGKGYAMEFGGDAGSDPAMLFFYVYTGRAATGAGAPGWQSSPGGFVRNGEWTHAVGVYDGSSLSLYINGELVGSAPANGPIVASPNALEFGGDPSNLSRAYSGMLDEVSIYERPLSAYEVRALFSTRDAGKCRTQ